MSHVGSGPRDRLLSTEPLHNLCVRLRIGIIPVMRRRVMLVPTRGQYSCWDHAIAIGDQHDLKTL